MYHTQSIHSTQELKLLLQKYLFSFPEINAHIWIPWVYLHVEQNIFNDTAHPPRVFNQRITFDNHGTCRYRYDKITIGSEGNDVTLEFYADCYGRIVNVHLSPRNIRPSEDRSLRTYVATLYRIEFLVHKNSEGVIVGASPPPHQPRREGSQSPTSSHGSTGTPWRSC